MTQRTKKPTVVAHPGVAEALKQARPFRSKSQELLLAVMLTSDRITGRLAKALADVVDITPQQYNVLRILRGAGSEGLATLAIADRMIERMPGITRLLDRLERKGWIERVRVLDDRRQVRCVATKSGLKILERLDTVVDRLDDLPAQELSRAELDLLVKLLDRLRALFD